MKQSSLFGVATAALLGAAACGEPSSATDSQTAGGTSGSASSLAGAAASSTISGTGGAGQGGTSGAPDETGGSAGSTTGGGRSSGGASGGNAGGDAGSSTGGASAASGTQAGGAAGTGGDSGGTDTPPLREIMTDTTGLHHVTFTARQLDSGATQGHATDTQFAAVDTSVPLKKKLCVILPDRGVKPGIALADWLYDKGYHVFQVAYQNDVLIAPLGNSDPDTPGDTRMDQFDGGGRVNWVTIQRADSIEERTAKALAYLATEDPGGDWGWFLNADGSVRWSDGCFVGFGYGGSHAAIIARYVRLGRVVSISAPDAEGRPDAAWLSTVSATPLDRLYALYGGNDNAQALGSYDDTTASLGYLGEIFHTTLNAIPDPVPYDGSHRIELDDQGHDAYCAPGANRPSCLYVFGLPQP